jgi:NAD(P)-dependent dehydrogenase (short-subunit alcohol dehydrogenase family)
MAVRTAVVTGAGSGVGRAVVHRLARDGWNVALVGRTPATLEETIRLAGNTSGKLIVTPCDIGDAAAVRAMAERVRADLGDASVLVNAAGTNTPRRNLAELSDADYRKVMDANLNGAYWCVHAFLPGMRRRGGGTIVNINSIAGKQASALSGVAYSMSKAGLAALTQSINAEENRNGVRACSIFPGDINTPLLEKRPTPPPPERRERMLTPEDITACVMLVIDLPERAVVHEMTITPRT